MRKQRRRSPSGRLDAFSDAALARRKSEKRETIPKDKYDCPEENMTLGAGVIARFLSNPILYGVIKDSKKPLLGFPGGSKDEPEKGIFDRDIYETAVRECKEELFSGLDVEVKITQENFLCRIPVSETHALYFFVADFPAQTPYCRGEKQEAAILVPAEKIDEYISEGIFLPNHARAWQIYKERRRKEDKVL